MRGIEALDKSIRKYEAALPQTRRYMTDEYAVKNGKAQVDIHLYEGLSLFDPLSMGKQTELNSDLYAFIDAKVYHISNFYDLRLCFHNAPKDTKTRQRIAACIQEHYSLLLKDKRLDLRLNHIKVFTLSAVGFALLGLYFLLQLSESATLFGEFLSIAGTFALWEAVDFLLLESRTLKSEWRNAGQSALAEITFEDAPHSA